MSLKTLYILIYVAVLLAGRFLSHSQRKSEDAVSQSKKITKDATAILMAVSVVIGFGMPLCEAALQENLTTEKWMTATGIAFMLAGFFITYKANRAIAENWSPVLEKTKEQRLVRSGVYAFVRHPLYLSGLLILVGTNIYFANTWSWFSILMVFIVTLYRIPIEEGRLEERYGQEYIDYKQKTKAIIPWMF